MNTTSKKDITLSLIKPELYKLEYGKIKTACTTKDTSFIKLTTDIINSLTTPPKPVPVISVPSQPPTTTPIPQATVIPPPKIKQNDKKIYGCLSACIHFIWTAIKQKEIREDDWEDLGDGLSQCLSSLSSSSSAVASSVAGVKNKIFTGSAQNSSQDDPDNPVSLVDLEKKIKTLGEAYDFSGYLVQQILKGSTISPSKKEKADEIIRTQRQKLIKHHFEILNLKCDIAESLALAGKVKKIDDQSRKDLKRKYREAIDAIGNIFQDEILMSDKTRKLFTLDHLGWRQQFSDLRKDYRAAFTLEAEKIPQEKIRLLRKELDLINLARKALSQQESPSLATHSEINKIQLDYIFLQCKEIAECFDINKYQNSALLDIFDNENPGFWESAFDSWEIRDNIREFLRDYKSHIHEIFKKKEKLASQLTKIKDELNELRKLDIGPTEISKNETERDKLTLKEKDLTNKIKKLDIAIYQTFLQKLIKILKASQIRKKEIANDVDELKTKKASKEKELKYIKFMINSEDPQKNGQNKFRATHLRDYNKEMKNELNEKHSELMSQEQIDTDLEGWKKLESNTKEEISTIKRNIVSNEALVEELENRVNYLDQEYHDLWERHRSLWLSVIPKKGNMKQKTVKTIKEVLTDGLTFGFIKVYEPLHPTELAIKHDFAMGGYRSTEVVKNWIEDILTAPNTQKKLIDELDNFERWAEKHPFTAAKMAGDLAHAISIFKLRSDSGIAESIFMPLLSSLRGRVFAYHMLVGFGSPHEEEVDDEPHEFPYRAIAELLAVSPELAMLTQSVGSISNIANLLNPFTAIPTATGMIGNYVVNKISAKTIETLLNKIEVKSQHLLLRVLRVGFNATIQLPYIDSVIEQERVQANAKSGTILQAALRPVKLASDIKANVKRWFMVVKESKGRERLIRLAPVFGVSIVAAPSILLFMGLTYISLGTIISLAYFIFPAIFFAYPKWSEFLNTKYKNTIDKVKRKEAENLYHLHRKRITAQYDAYVEEYIEALQDGLSLPKFTKPELTPDLPEDKIQKCLNDQEFSKIVKRVARSNEKIFTGHIKEVKKALKSSSELLLISDAEITEAFASSINLDEIADKVSTKLEKHFGTDLSDDVMNYLVNEALHQIGNKLLGTLRTEFDDNFKQQVILHLIEYGNTNKLFLTAKVKTKKQPKMILQKQIEKDLKEVEGLDLTEKERKGFGASLLTVMKSITNFNKGEIHKKMLFNKKKTQSKR